MAIDDPSAHFLLTSPPILHLDGNHGHVPHEDDMALVRFGIELEELLQQDTQPLPADESSHTNGILALAQHQDAHPVHAHGVLERLPVDPGFVSVGGAPTASTPPRPVVPATESIGVTYHRKNKQWEAHLWVRGANLCKRKMGKQVFLGNYATADEAKHAHDRAAIKLNVRKTKRGKVYPLNFPEAAQAHYMAEHSGWSKRDFLWKLRRSSAKFTKGKSTMKGVSERRSVRTSGGWGQNGKGRAAMHAGVVYEAKISRTREGGKRMFDLGRFENEEEAGKAYDRALLFLNAEDELKCITNFRPSTYSAGEILGAALKNGLTS